MPVSSSALAASSAAAVSSKLAGGGVNGAEQFGHPSEEASRA